MPNIDLDLTGRRALVTGSSRGIGLAVAALLARHGAQVAIHARTDNSRTQEALDTLPGNGHTILAADLADPDAAAALAGQAAEALGGLDIVVNNAGIYETMPTAGEDPERWRQIWEQTIAINLTAPALICQAAIPLVEPNQGYIINVSSRGAYRGEAEAPAYGASKSGLNNLGQSLAVALAPRGVKIITLAPGWVETDMTREILQGAVGPEVLAQFPMGRVIEPDELAWLVLLSVSGKVDSLTGTVIDLSGASYLR